MSAGCAAPRPAGQSQRQPPPITVARIALVVAAVHVLIPALLWLDQGPLQAEIRAQNPGFDSATVHESAAIALIAGSVFHLVHVALNLIAAVLLRRGRLWRRRFTTGAQLVGIVLSAVSWSSSPQFHILIPLVDLVQAVIVALLWIPASARHYFIPRK